MEKKIKVMIGTPNYTDMMSGMYASQMAHCCAEWSKKYEVAWTVVRRTFICKARQQIALAARDWGADYLLWVDDDALINPGVLDQMIAHDKEIVIAPYPLREAPHVCGVLRSSTGNFEDQTKFVNLDWDKDMKQGLVEVDGGGTHCMLTKVSVYGEPTGWGPDGSTEQMTFEDYKKTHPGQIPWPWFVLAPMGGTEDMYFCLMAKRVGLKVYCDTDIETGHIGFAPYITVEDARKCKKLEALTQGSLKSLGGLNSTGVKDVKVSEASGTSTNTPDVSAGVSGSPAPAI